MVGLLPVAGCNDANNDPPRQVAPTYTVSGSVSGLDGSLTLMNNGDARTTLVNGAFTFATPVNSGTNYNVTVTTQPVGQTCAVSGGTGTIAAANITTVIVTCVTNTVTIGGTVTGLTGTGLVLQNNAGNNLAIGAAGAFTFSTPITQGGAYNVTVLTQPIVPVQTCTATNNSGNATTNVTNVTITCATSTIAPTFTLDPANVQVIAPATATFTAAAIGTPAPTLKWQLSTNSGTSWSDIAGATNPTYTTPSTSVADTGKWYRAVASNSAATVYSNAASLTVIPGAAGKSWSAPIVLSSLDAGADAPKIAFDASGNAIAVWEESEPDFSWNIWTARYTVAGGWSAPMILDTDTHPARIPDLAMDAAGNAWAVWVQEDGTRSNLWGRRYSASSGWEAAALLETEDLNVNMYSARVVMDAAGHALVIWKVDAPDPETWQSVRARAYVNGWMPMQTLATGNVGITSAEIATNSSGRAVLVYSSVTSDSPLLVDIFAESCDLAAGSCGGPAALEQDTSGGWDVEPQVAVNAAGNATAIWRRYDSATSVYSLRANRLIGGSWGSPVLIEAQATDVSSRHSVTMDTDGNAIAVWAQQVGVQPNQHVTIFANRFDVSAGWEAEVQIEPQTRAEDFFPAQGPRVAYGPDGNAITVWQSGSGVISAMEFANGSWAPMRDIGPGGSGVSRNPQIVFDNTGAGVAIFVEDAGPASAACIKVSRYE